MWKAHPPGTQHLARGRTEGSLGDARRSEMYPPIKLDRNPPPATTAALLPAKAPTLSVY